MFSEIFYSMLVATFSACMMVLLKGILKSKCKTVKCFGVECERDLEIELKDREMDNVNPLTPTARL
jgi:hypothetical protein